MDTETDTHTSKASTITLANEAFVEENMVYTTGV